MDQVVPTSAREVGPKLGRSGLGRLLCGLKEDFQNEGGVLDEKAFESTELVVLILIPGCLQSWEEGKNGT